MLAGARAPPTSRCDQLLDRRRERVDGRRPSARPRSTRPAAGGSAGSPPGRAAAPALELAREVGEARQVRRSASASAPVGDLAPAAAASRGDRLARAGGRHRRARIRQVRRRGRRRSPAPAGRRDLRRGRRRPASARPLPALATRAAHRRARDRAADERDAVPRAGCAPIGAAARARVALVRSSPPGVSTGCTTCATLAARVHDLAAIDREERGEPRQHAELLRHRARSRARARARPIA